VSEVAVAGSIELGTILVPPGLIMGGYSRLLDAWLPVPMVMLAPAFLYPRHEIRFEISQAPSESSRGKGWAMKHPMRAARSWQRIHLGDSKIFIDCRHDTSANIAHVLQYQIGVALMGLRTLGMSDRYRDMVFVVLRETPAYALDLFRLMGFGTIAVDNETIVGTRMSTSPRELPYRAAVCEYLWDHAVRIGLLADRDPDSDPVFLCRRGARKLNNLSEIEPLLNRRGFRTLYAEDLSMEDQVTTLARARTIFGLHGAGMGLLMFRNPEKRGLVIEAFPCGYPTNWVRAICASTNDAWLGLQGQLDPIAVSNLLGKGHPRANACDSYCLDPRVVNRSLSLIAEGRVVERIQDSVEMLANASESVLIPIKDALA